MHRYELLINVVRKWILADKLIWIIGQLKLNNLPIWDQFIKSTKLLLLQSYRSHLLRKYSKSWVILIGKLLK
jgi:hypothetical protein